MKKIIITYLFLIPLVSLAQKKFVLSGRIETDSAEMAFLRYHTSSGLKSDSSSIIDGKFTFSAPISGITEGYLSIASNGKLSTPRKIYLEPAELKLKSGRSDLKDAVITGSTTNDDYHQLLNELMPVAYKNESLLKKWRSTRDKTDTAFRRAFLAEQTVLELESRKIKRAYATKHFDTYIGLVAALESGMINLNDDFESSVKEFKKFSPQVRSTNLGSGLQEQIDGALKTKIGRLAMDFTQQDTKGEPVKLSDFRGKYVLLDFWASWCAPCRQETPVLVDAYQKYHEKGFTILSVSLDKATEKQAWLKAIEKDGMVWFNVSDLNYWRNQAAVLYGVKTVPANFLIDPSGKIIAKDLRGDQVESKLAELLR